MSLTVTDTTNEEAEQCIVGFVVIARSSSDGIQRNTFGLRTTSTKHDR